MSETNPYHPPQATVADPQEAEVGEIRILSARGRLGRVRYIAYATVMTLAAYVLIAAGGLLSGLGEAGALVGVLFGLAATIGSTLITILLAVQRLHDFNATGWWVLAFLVPLINLGLTIALLIVPGTPIRNRFGPPPPPNTLGVVIVAVLIPLLLVAAIIAVVAVPGLEGWLLSIEVSSGSR
jgi:uncharacterized membrane protein YhaH (DUF805 family)